MRGWNWEEGNVAYADGTGTFEAGWYAISESSRLSCGEPDDGPFGTREEAEAAAQRLDEEAAK